ncbi:hypothetical protein Lal_00037158 [Lupinus albus]|nr:hypothetical protein Lal_00037158 [Lupinus albus]
MGPLMFDIKTVFSLIVVVCFSLGLTILTAASSEQQSGLYKVSFGNLILGSGYLLLILSAIAYRQQLLWLGLMLVCISAVVFYGALCQFLKLKIPRLIVALIVLYNAIVGWFFIDEDELRLVLTSVAIIGIEGILGYTLISYWKEIKGRGKYLVLMSVIVNILIVSIRAAATLLAGAVTDVFDEGLYQSLLYVSMLSTILCWSLGFVLMAKERSDYLNMELILKDALTGVWNRRYLNQTGSSELSRHKRHGKPAAVAVIDIDNFKKINDQYGHPRGDEILIKVASACLNVIRDTDTLGRWGGEEFVAIFPGTTIESLTPIAEKLRATVNQIEVEPGKKISISVGLALCGSTDSWESWFERADSALYQAKAMGKNMVRLAS